MIKWALIQDGKISEIYDMLPDSWANISNFYVITDEDFLKSLGWYSFEDTPPIYDPTTHTSSVSYTFENGVVTSNYTVESITNPIVPPSEEELEWEKVRQKRDQLMKDFEWRYTRLERQKRLSLSTTDSIEKLDKYMQDLADITSQNNPFGVVWPEYQ